MLTNTDIPPGGEGKIEVTFDSSHKKGQQKKSIAIESNDSRNPRMSVNVSAFVEVVFGFEEYNLDMGKIRKGQPFSKTAILTVKDPLLIKTIKLASSSPHIKANLLNTPEAAEGKLRVEVSGTSEIPVGRINATVTARVDDRSASETTLKIKGNIVGNLDISQDEIRFHIDTSNNDSESLKQIVEIVSTADNIKFHILGVQDDKQRLIFHVDTLVADKQYKISMTPQPSVINSRQNISGIVEITTDDKEQPVTRVTYSIIFSR